MVSGADPVLFTPVGDVSDRLGLILIAAAVVVIIP